MVFAVVCATQHAFSIQNASEEILHASLSTENRTCLLWQFIYGIISTLPCAMCICILHNSLTRVSQTSHQQYRKLLSSNRKIRRREIAFCNYALDILKWNGVAFHDFNMFLVFIVFQDFLFLLFLWMTYIVVDIFGALWIYFAQYNIFSNKKTNEFPFIRIFSQQKPTNKMHSKSKITRYSFISTVHQSNLRNFE